MSSNGYILLVEDEVHVQANNKKILNRRGYDVKQAYTLKEARKMIAEEFPMAIILDVHLPDGNGLDLLRELRETSHVPVLMLTAMGTAADIIKGLEAGGDDYLPKPYELSVFLMRVKALMRRANYIPERVEVGPIRVDTASNKVYVFNEDINLQIKEAALLRIFMQQPGTSFKADYLYEKVWGQAMHGDDNALKVAVSKLRTKLAASGYTIYAHRGEGYSFELT